MTGNTLLYLLLHCAALATALCVPLISQLALLDYSSSKPNGDMKIDGNAGAVYCSDLSNDMFSVERFELQRDSPKSCVALS